MSPAQRRGTEARRLHLTRNTIWNLVGTGVPLTVAILVIPPLLERIGPDRFGILTLVWIVTGYNSLFEPGIARAVTRAVARMREDGSHPERLRSLVWSTLRLTFAAGVVAGGVVAVLGRWIVGAAIHVPPALHGELVGVVYLLAASLPLVTVMLALAGTMAAHERFGLISAIRAPAGSLNYAVPLVVAAYTPSLVLIVAALVVVRLATGLALLLACRTLVPLPQGPVAPQRGAMADMARHGGWMTVSNIVGPLILYADRLLIVGLASTTALAYYATPYELVDKLRMVPAALMGAAFPALAASATQDRRQAARIFMRMVKTTLIALLPATVAIIALADGILRSWVGADFAAESAIVMRLLAVAVLLSGLGRAPFALLQGAGRADLTAKLHLLELPLFLVVGAWAVETHGVAGIAAATAGRAAVHAALLYLLSWSVVLSPKAA